MRIGRQDNVGLQFRKYGECLYWRDQLIVTSSVAFCLLMSNAVIHCCLQSLRYAGHVHHSLRSAALRSTTIQHLAHRVDACYQPCYFPGPERPLENWKLRLRKGNREGNTYKTL